MQKAIYSFLSLLLVPALLHAQAYEGTVEYNKKKHAALIVEYPYPPEAVENAIITKMEKMGYKGKEEKGLFNGDKGFRKYKDAFISEVHDRSHDYIIKVEKRSKKQDDKSVVYFIMLKDEANAIAVMDAENLNKAKSFLNNLHPGVEASHLEIRIRSQEDVVTKAEKKLRNLQGEKEDMEKKLKKLQEDIEKNIKDQEAAQKEIEGQKQALEVLKTRRQ